MGSKEKIQSIKKDFFSLRNGMVADSLRKLYPSGCLIFGLMVPQFLDMEKKYSKDLETGILLWNENSSREARLFSLYLIPPNELSLKQAIEMIEQVESYEQGDFLAFRILRNLQEASQLLYELKLKNHTDPFILHCIEMFEKNLKSN